MLIRAQTLLRGGMSMRLRGPAAQRMMLKKYRESNKKIDEVFQRYKEPTKTFYKNGFTEAQLKQGNEMVRRAFSLENATPGEIEKYRIAQAVRKYQMNLLDHGSSAVQCAVMSEKIIIKMLHTKKFPHDKQAGRALTRMIQVRRRMLNDCMRRDYQRYRWLCLDYGIPDEPSHGLHKHHWFKLNCTSGY